MIEVTITVGQVTRTILVQPDLLDRVPSAMNDARQDAASRAIGAAFFDLYEQEVRRAKKDRADGPR